MGTGWRKGGVLEDDEGTTSLLATETRDRRPHSSVENARSALRDAPLEGARLIGAACDPSGPDGDVAPRVGPRIAADWVRIFADLSTVTLEPTPGASPGYGPALGGYHR